MNIFKKIWNYLDDEDKEVTIDSHSIDELEKSREFHEEMGYQMVNEEPLVDESLYFKRYYYKMVRKK